MTKKKKTTIQEQFCRYLTTNALANADKLYASLFCVLFRTFPNLLIRITHRARVLFFRRISDFSQICENTPDKKKLLPHDTIFLFDHLFFARFKPKPPNCVLQTAIGTPHNRQSQFRHESAENRDEKKTRKKSIQNDTTRNQTKDDGKHSCTTCDPRRDLRFSSTTVFCSHSNQNNQTPR